MVLLDFLISFVKIIGYCLSPFCLFIYRIISRKPPPKADFKNDIVLVTGGGRGVGRELASEFCHHGAGTVVLWDINETTLKQTKDHLVSQGYEVFTYVVDCSNREQVYQTAERVRAEVGHVSVLVNNAGIASTSGILDVKDSEIDRVYQINTLAHYWLTRAFLPWMLENDYGYIVNVVSVAAFTGFPGLSIYSSSKAAAMSLCESLKLELRQKNKNCVSVTAVCPWHIAGTGMFDGFSVPMHYLFPALKPNDVAKKAVQAAYERKFCLVLPSLFWLPVIVKLLLPSKAVLEMYDIMAGKGDPLKSIRTSSS